MAIHVNATGCAGQQHLRGPYLVPITSHFLRIDYDGAPRPRLDAWPMLELAAVRNVCILSRQTERINRHPSTRVHSLDSQVPNVSDPNFMMFLNITANFLQIRLLKSPNPIKIIRFRLMGIPKISIAYDILEKCCIRMVK